MQDEGCETIAAVCTLETTRGYVQVQLAHSRMIVVNIENKSRTLQSEMRSTCLPLSHTAEVPLNQKS